LGKQPVGTTKWRMGDNMKRHLKKGYEFSMAELLYFRSPVKAGSCASGSRFPVVLM
jgi:hypothetical protein